MDVRPYQLAQRRDFEFRFENQPFVVNEEVQNPLNVRIINLLHDRTLDALYEVHDKVEQALEVSQATFEALMSCEETSGDYKCLFDTEVHSNIFVEVCEGDALLDKLKEFPSKWTVHDAFYQMADLITGRVSCSSSDQMIMFKMRWNVDKRHFVIESLNHITNDAMFPPPIFGQDPPVLRYHRP
ncbi:hypothetical protein GCK72_022112 [Caenorhabditis remanei]|uniref:Uncharacterized protein n=1 Tax=Caenorhabditis remanei TaxID=31234 RepID=A0A6A5FT26_CAERE|nr:hypothetical protein GCK72_022112 [Caenorhabditis remanei]KAF1745665.1 hypothetical protein GCK72_022112 [Caenorhabditis remanei]